MPVDLSSKKNRAELKAFFVRGARPTAAQFADLIDGMVNLKDDGIAKTSGSPLQLQADSSAAASLQRVIEFYKNFTDAKPAWTVQMKSSAAGGAGLHIFQDTRQALSIDESTLRVDVAASKINGIAIGFKPTDFAVDFPYETISTIDKSHNLRLFSFSGIVFHTGNNNQHRAQFHPNGNFQMFSGAIIPKAGADGGIVFPPDAFGGGGDLASIRYLQQSGESTKLEIKNLNDPNDDIELSAAGTVRVKSRFDVDNSEIYFTNTEHDHTGTGNAKGFAAIENSKAHDCLMVLGRAVGTNQKRKIGMWDEVVINGDLHITGTLHVNGEATTYESFKKIPRPVIVNPGGPFFPGGGVFNTGSDARLKTDINPLHYGLAELLRVEPVSFHWKKHPSLQKSFGVIAQALQPVMPELVAEDENHPDGHGLMVAYQGLIPVLINAVKELNRQIEVLKMQFSALQPA